MKMLPRLLLYTLTAFLFIGAKSAISQSSKPLEYFNLFEGVDKISCFRIPAMVTAPNGDLIAAVDERMKNCADLKGNRDINIVIKRSADNGKTWLPMQKVVNYPLGQSASDPSFIVDEVTNEIFMFFNYMDVDKEKDIYYLKFTSSKNNGKSWSKPVDITSQITKPEWHNDFKFITSGRGIQTASGKLLHALVNLDKGVFVVGSDDHGKTWFLKDTAIKPADESKIVELSNGSWMVNSRVNGAGVRYIHTSSDMGNTWTSKADSALLDPGCNAEILRYKSTKGSTSTSILLFTNANSKDKRENLTIKVSDDDGKTWSKGKIIYSGSAAYSSVTIMKNGDIGVLFEKNNYAGITFTSFSLKWLMAEK